MPATPTWRARDIELEALDGHSVPLVRLFRFPKMDWEPPEPKYRNKRVDPPPGQEDTFAILYTASTLACAAIECRLLNADDDDRYTWKSATAAAYSVVRYEFTETALFIPIDGKNKERFCLTRPEAQFKAYLPTQELALALYQRFGALAHGLSWESFHRNQPGRSYAIWHHRKASMGLRITPPAPYPTLHADPEWLAFLKEHPDIEAISS